MNGDAKAEPDGADEANPLDSEADIRRIAADTEKRTFVHLAVAASGTGKLAMGSSALMIAGLRRTSTVLGPGSNDGGVDLRVYPADAAPDLPSMILVQCKRQKAKIDKVLVKSVFADVLEEGASSGLIVTTSTLSPGGETTRTARNYPVEAADRATIRSWIDKLRS